MRILTIIPARGGSKRLPQKNLLTLANKPLIAWTIEAAKQSKYISDIVVSTDDEFIAEVSKNYGASVPFIRPHKLSSDTATTIDVVKHCIHFYKVEMAKEYDFILLLQPTSPLRTVEDIDGAIKLLIDKKADSVISICECEHPPLWSNILPEDKNLDNFDRKELKNIRSQDLPVYYRYNGAIYLTNIERLFEDDSFSFDSNSFAYIMPQNKSVDIDSELDFKFAEFLLLDTK